MIAFEKLLLSPSLVFRGQLFVMGNSKTQEMDVGKSADQSNCSSFSFPSALGKKCCRLQWISQT